MANSIADNESFKKPQTVEDVEEAINSYEFDRLPENFKNMISIRKDEIIDDETSVKERALHIFQLLDRDGVQLLLDNKAFVLQLLDNETKNYVQSLIFFNRLEKKSSGYYTLVKRPQILKNIIMNLIHFSSPKPLSYYYTGKWKQENIE